MIRTVAALVLAAGLACAAAPAAQRTHAIAPGVRGGGIAVGGLSAVPARDRIAERLSQPVTVAYAGEETIIAPRKLGARLDVTAAVSAALAATPGSRIALPLRTSPKQLAAAVAA